MTTSQGKGSLFAISGMVDLRQRDPAPCTASLVPDLGRNGHTHASRTHMTLHESFPDAADFSCHGCE